MKFTGSAILPAAQVLFNKAKVALGEIPVQWPSGTVVVCKKPNGRLHFIAGAGGAYFKPGVLQSFYHDQTGSSFGEWLVVNEIQYDTVGGAVQWKPAVPFSPELNANTTAAMAVFK